MSATTEATPTEEVAKNGETTEQPKENSTATENDTAAPKNGTANEKPDQPGQPSGKTMFALNIPTSLLFTMEQELKDIFSQYGEIKTVKRAGIQVDGPATETTLAAYIHFMSNESAEKALAEQGRNLGGNPLELFVLKAGPNSVVADSLPVTISIDCLKNLLSPCGNIKNVVKIPGRRTAFVEFEDEEGAKKALTLNGKLMINNVKISLEKRDGDSKPVINQKNNKPAPNNSLKPPMRAARRTGSFAPRGAMSQPYNSGYRGSGGRGRGIGRGGFRGGNSGGGYGGGYGGGNYWGNEYNSNDGDRPHKRRKPNDFIRHY